MVAKITVGELATELGLTAKEILGRLERMGVFVNDARSAIEEGLARRLRDQKVEAKAKVGAKGKKPAAGTKKVASKAKAPAAKKAGKSAAEKVVKAKPAVSKRARAVPAEVEVVIPPKGPAVRVEKEAEVLHPEGKAPVAVPEVAPPAPKEAAMKAPAPPPQPVQQPVVPPAAAPEPLRKPAPPKVEKAEKKVVPLRPRRRAEAPAPAAPSAPPAQAQVLPAAAPIAPPVEVPPLPVVERPPLPLEEIPVPVAPAKAPAAVLEAPPVVEEPPKEVKRELIKLPESITVSELAGKMQRKAGEIIKALLGMGVMATVNELLDISVVRQVAAQLGFDVEVRSLEGEEIVEEVVDPTLLLPRDPVVTVMGHVDHGKTSLLDAIRKTKVVASEFGGITQHIGAYKVATDRGGVTFLDTPGHEAFTAMRARGARVTDIVVLVVAADDGVMPQTVEAINHAKAANVSIVVALNKIDKPGADPERIMRDLTNYGLVPEAWGGQTIYVETSAKKGIGIDSLIEMILLQAEIMELKANPNRAARGTIVEAKLERGRGPVATVLVQQGTLHEGDVVVAGMHYGRVRAMFTERGKKVKSAGPADPVEVLGLSGVPQAGDTLVALDEERKARQIALKRQEKERRQVAGTARVTLEDLHRQIKTGEVKELRLILKADVQGSVGAISESLERLSTDEVKLKVIHGSVGTITESDVMLASASNAIVLGFNVRPEPKAMAQAQAEGVDVRAYTVIYEAINDIRAALEGMLAPEIREVLVGKAQIKALFPISRVGLVVGCQVTEGKATRSTKVRLVRDGKPVQQGQIASLKRFKDDVREVAAGLECGIGLEGIAEPQVGDVLEFFNTEEVARTLS